VQLAKTLIRLSGKSEDEVSISFTGLREGEKLHEELFFSGENVCSTSEQKIRRVRSKPMTWSNLDRHLKELRASMSIDGAAPILAKLSQIVPEYTRGREENPPNPDEVLINSLHRAATRG
jgi:FlaA1/EpsC-like NDP-sugar epimerase